MGDQEGDAMANVECLRQLRRVVEAAPEDRFDMRWISTLTDCGTAYCTAGWAGIDPWFRQHTELGRAFRVGLGGMLNWDEDLAEVLGKVFGLTDRETYRLFGLFVGEGDEATRRHVLANIDRLLAGEPARSYADMIAGRG
jgi:hypothetical protein